jgi:hypothetical protein
LILQFTLYILLYFLLSCYELYARFVLSATGRPCRTPPATPAF